MTITIRRSTAAVLIALVGVLGGLAISNVSDAFSSNPPAKASYVAPFESSLKEIARDLHTMKGSLASSVGKPGIDGSIIELLQDIKGNTYGTCQAAGGNPFCHSF